jgi:hypothetical protein
VLRRVGFFGEAHDGSIRLAIASDGAAVMTKKVLHLLLRSALPTQRSKHREATGAQ